MSWNKYLSALTKFLYAVTLYHWGFLGILCCQDLFHLLWQVWLSPLIERDELPVFSVPLQRCLEIQRASLSPKRSAFGDLSAEVADTLQLIGSVEMTEGRIRQAHRTMAKVTTQTAQVIFFSVTTCWCALVMLDTVNDLSWCCLC